MAFSHCPNTGRSLTSGRALIGRVIAGRYRVLALLGTGGMGAVYVAEHLALGRKVAVKRLHPELAADQQAVARFQREARSAGATGHEHIVEVIDLGFGEDGAPFLVMEYVRGRSLSHVLKEDGAPGLAPRRACRIVGQVLAALAAVHEQQIVHRDLKPDNILLTRKGIDEDFVKVLDFGISKMRQEEGETPTLHLTRTGVTMGTPFYMSPEQARGVKDVDHRVDLFAVGVILYELLSGKLPFNGENYHQLLQTILSASYTPLPRLRPELDVKLTELVHRAIAHDPKDRFQSARGMLLALVPHGAVDPGERDYGSQPRLPAVVASDEALVARSLGVAEVRNTPTGLSTPLGLAPSPAVLSGPPRHFTARSEDYDGADIAGEYQSGVVRKPAPPLTSQRSTPREPRSERGSTRVKAPLVISALEYLGDKGSLDRVLDNLDSEVADRLAVTRLPMSWVPLFDYCALLRSAERVVAGGDSTFSIRVGRALANRELSSTHRLFMRTATPDVAVERIPELFRTYHSGGRVELSRGTAGAYRIEIFDLRPDTLPHALAMSGFYQRLLELAGAMEVKCSVVSCRERGDQSTITILRWADSSRL